MDDDTIDKALNRARLNAMTEGTKQETKKTLVDLYMKTYAEGTRDGMKSLKAGLEASQEAGLPDELRPGIDFVLSVIGEHLTTIEKSIKEQA